MYAVEHPEMSACEPANESNGFTLMKGLSTHGVNRLMEKANLPPEVYHAE